VWIGFHALVCYNQLNTLLNDSNYAYFKLAPKTNETYSLLLDQIAQILVVQRPAIINRAFKLSSLIF